MELHHTTLEDGVLAMRPATGQALVVPAGGELVMEPAGLHAMCLDPPAPLVEGERIEVTVQLERAGAVSADLMVEQR